MTHEGRMRGQSDIVPQMPKPQVEERRVARKKGEPIVQRERKTEIAYALAPRKNPMHWKFKRQQGIGFVQMCQDQGTSRLREQSNAKSIITTGALGDQSNGNGECPLYLCTSL